MLLRCGACGRYSMMKACPACGASTARPGPAKYSPEDAYGSYRRRLKRLTKTGGS
ncbi:MAG TPA: nucleolar RNA-binding Nop10p family protein [Candidatus Thermoplasmatota archaeon]|nr:nucleolar RNA-binding Nop10p family protein [Candidatus Thermoplasmatota archaeon]